MCYIRRLLTTCPNCSLTRAGLMTGRYNYRTGVTEVVRGNFMMFSDEVTIAEMLRDTGYRTLALCGSAPRKPVPAGASDVAFHAVQLPAIKGRLETFLKSGILPVPGRRGSRLGFR